jgi:RHS repeat-associated protein
LSSLAQDASGTTYDQTLGFAYSPTSQIVSNTRSNDLFAWGGHGSGTTSSTANGLNQLTLLGGTGTSHDSRGNMTADALGRTFGYTSENLLTSANGSVSLAYDPAMRLYQVTGSATTRFQYDGADAIAEYNGSNALQRRYVHGPGTDEPLVWYEGSGTTDRRFLHADERGSVVAVSNGSGTVTSVNTYDEYGKPGSGNVGRFQYTGQKWIADVGLYDYKARMYHPSLGRFMQTDPIRFGGGMNIYGYVGQDPLNFVDTWGTQEVIIQGSCPGASTWDSEKAKCVSGVSAIGSGGYSTGGVDPAALFQALQDSEQKELSVEEPECAPGDKSCEVVITSPGITTDHRPQNAFFVLAGQRGGNNVRSSEFAGRSDEDLKSELKNADAKTRIKIIRELKGRAARNANKVRGGGIFRFFPFILWFPGDDYWIRCGMPNNDPNCREA